MDGHLRGPGEHAWRQPHAVPTVNPSTVVHAAQLSSLALTLRVLQPLLARQDVTEICINRPGEAFLETRTGWQQMAIPFADYHWCYRLPQLNSHTTPQRTTDKK